MRQQEEKAACIFLAHRDFVKEQTLRYAPSPGLSEDIFQDVFIEFVSKSDHWNLEGDIQPLLVHLIQRFACRAIDEKKKSCAGMLGKVIDELRIVAERRQEMQSELISSPYEEKKQALKKCLNLLPPRSRALIDLYYFENIPSEKIAERMLLSVNAVYLAIHRIRVRLKKCINQTLVR